MEIMESYNSKLIQISETHGITASVMNVSVSFRHNNRYMLSTLNITEMISHDVHVDMIILVIIPLLQDF